MEQYTDWRSLTKALDYTAIPLPLGSVRRWIDYVHTQTGLAFRCETVAGETAMVWLDVIFPDVVRILLARDVPAVHISAMLVQEEWPAPPFEVTLSAQRVILTTSRMRVEVQRYPWQMRAYAPDAQSPFFSQRVDDRAYGPAYETPPMGFWQTEECVRGVHEAIAVSPGEAFYGFGEKFTALDKWGQRFVSWATDAGNVTSQRAYKNIPFWMSSAGYGIFLHTSAPVAYDIGATSNSTVAFDVLADELDYFLIYGPRFTDILKCYTDLTGRAPVPPKWSFGFWISRCGYKSRAEVEAVVHEMRARDFPGDVLSLDPWWMGDGPWCTYEWDTEAFPNPPEMLAALRAQGVRTCLWITPYVVPGCRAYEEGMAGGYFLKRADGELAPVVEAFAGVNLAAVDFTNPAATAWYQAKLTALLDAGAAVFKSDFGEQAPADAVYHDERSGVEMHNLYPLLYNRAVFEATQRTFGRGLTWGRSAYAGSQRYPVQWGGDSYASFEQMAGQLRGLLSYGLSGVPFCSHDIGGFDYPPRVFDAAVPEEARADADNILEWGQRFGATLQAAGKNRDAEVYIRWLQFGVFSSHARAHGKQPREPWEYGPEAEAIARRYLKLRYRLLPYIYTEAVKSSQTGLPLVRPLVLDYQDDPNTAHIDLQYLFGDSFLVAPILTRRSASLTARDARRKVYLPTGEWVDYWTKSLATGGRWIDVDAPLDVLPLWVKAGAVIPMGPEMKYVGQKPLDPLTLEFYAPQASGEFIIYDEDRPDITVQYTTRGDTLIVEVANAPVEVIAESFASGLHTIEISAL